MRRLVTLLIGALVVSVLALVPGGVAQAADPVAVVALVDSGVNPYAAAFRDRSPLAQRHPSTYIAGYPKDAIALRLTLDVPYAAARERDKDVWAEVEQGTLYWIPGTRFIGAISFGAGGKLCPVVPVPPANGPTSTGCTETAILDDHGHGTMTASRAAGAPNSLAPNARILAIEGLGAAGVAYAAEAGWVDVISNSWGSLLPAGGLISAETTGTAASLAESAKAALVLFASGNGLGLIVGVAPANTYMAETGPPGVVLVGGHDNGRITAWSSAPPHVVADAYAGFAAPRDSIGPMAPDPIACCTSAAAPYASGGAAALVLEARRILGHGGAGVREGVVARGRPGVVKRGPLADGVFTLEELKMLLLRSAERRPAKGRDDGNTHWAGRPGPPDHPTLGPGANPFCVLCTTTPADWMQVPATVDAYPMIGYGAVNERSVALAVRVMRGEVALPDRATEDADYERDQSIRSALMGP